MRELLELVDGLSLSEKLNLMSCPSVNKARERLQRSYQSRDKLLTSAGLAKGKAMPMDKILINICLLSAEEVRKAFKEPSFSSGKDEERSEYIFSKILKEQRSLLSLEELFKAKQKGEEDPDKVVASGGAGCGKSVCFTRKAPYEWAFGRLWQQFALLFCLELRDRSVWQAKTLADLLRLAELHLSARELEEAVQFITNHPDKVVIVCDGLDEGSVDESSLLWRLLQGKCAGVPCSLHFVVTTRPCSAAGELSQSISHRGVEVVGFTKEDVASFARKYLGTEVSRRLLFLLDQQPFIAGMMHSPLFCLLICDLFQEEQQLPSRKTETFEKIAVALLRRHAKTHGLDMTFQGWSDVPVSLREMVIGLGKVAFEGLKRKQLYFTDVELTKAAMLAAALELGLLTKSESTSFAHRDRYTFSHLTLQEFVAALYVSSKILRTRRDMVNLLEGVRFNDGHLSTFWEFLAGLLKGNMIEAFFHAYVTSWSSAMFSSALPYRCYAESYLGMTHTPSASVAELLSKHPVEFFMKSLSVSDCAAISTVLQCHIEASKRMSLIEMRACSVNTSGFAQLFPGLRHCRNIERLDLSHNDCAFSPQQISSLSAVLANNASALENVSLAYNEIGDNELEKLSAGLKKCRKLGYLNLSGTRLTSRSGPTLRNVISFLPGLRWLDVNMTSLRDHGFEQLARGLQLCTGLHFLDVRDTGLSTRSIPILTRLMSQHPSLELHCPL